MSEVAGSLERSEAPGAGTAPAEATSRRARIWQAAEFALLFGAVPVSLAVARLPGTVLPVLLVGFIVCLVYLLRDRGFPRERLWNARAARRELPGILLRFVLIAPLITLAVWLFDRGSFLNFPRQAPVIWALVMVLYPLLSVYPQEVIFRAFLFRRYRRLFPGPRERVWASAFAFGFVHIIFHSWLSVALTLPGGYLLADNYRRSRSLLAVALEHSLYGCLVFTVGWGRHFYNGM